MQLIVNIKEEKNSLTHIEQFKFLSTSISKIGSLINIQILPFKNEQLPFFSNLSLEKQNFTNIFLKNILEIYQAAISDNVDIEDSKTILWYTIRKFGLRPGSDLFNILDKNDIIEIHSENNQVFRSLNYFKLCSYSIEELTCQHWAELYHRENHIMQLMLNYAKDVFLKKEIIAAKIPLHVVEETSSLNMYKILYNLKYLCPLYDFGNSNVNFFLATIDAKLLD